MSDITRDQLKTMRSDEIVKAQREGRLAHLGIALDKNPWGETTPADLPSSPYERSDGGQFTEDDVKQMKPSQRSRAYADGKLNHLLQTEATQEERDRWSRRNGWASS